MTQQHRQISNFDDSVFKEGYDSYGLCPPSIGRQVSVIDDCQADENPLPVGPPAVSVEVTPAKMTRKKFDSGRS